MTGRARLALPSKAWKDKSIPQKNVNRNRNSIPANSSVDASEDWQWLEEPILSMIPYRECSFMAGDGIRSRDTVRKQLIGRPRSPLAFFPRWARARYEVGVDIQIEDNWRWILAQILNLCITPEIAVSQQMMDKCRIALGMYCISGYSQNVKHYIGFLFCDAVHR